MAKKTRKEMEQKMNRKNRGRKLLDFVKKKEKLKCKRKQSVGKNWGK